MKRTDEQNEIFLKLKKQLNEAETPEKEYVILQSYVETLPQRFNIAMQNYIFFFRRFGFIKLLIKVQKYFILFVRSFQFSALLC